MQYENKKKSMDKHLCNYTPCAGNSPAGTGTDER